MIAENGVTTEFMTFNGLVLSGYNKDGEQTEHYYYGNSLLAVEYANADLFYYLKNSHGDVIGFTDNTGTLTETYRYDAFGTLTNIQSLNEDGVLAKAETALSRFLYAGEQYDAVTGLYYLRARQYDTVAGRFTQEDTYLGDGRNLYVYVSNNPLKYVDPSGREKSGGYDNSEEYVITYIGYPYSEQKNVVEEVKELLDAFKEDAARATDDFCIGFFYELGSILTFGLYHDPEAEKIKYIEAFQMGAGFVDKAVMYPQLVSFKSNLVGKRYYTPYYGKDTTIAKTSLLPITSALTTENGLSVIALPPSNVMQLSSANIISQKMPNLSLNMNSSENLDASSLTETYINNDNNWNMPIGGGEINGIEYSQHALERMAPNTSQVRAELSRRAEVAAEQLGYKVGTKEYYEFCEKYVDPRNIPPSVVENAISSSEAVQGNYPNTLIYETEDVRVITNSDGKVITVIPK